MNGPFSILGHLVAVRRAMSAHVRRRNKREWEMDAIRADRKARLWYQAELLAIVRVLRADVTRAMSAIRHDFAERPAHHVGDAAPPAQEVSSRVARQFGNVEFTAKRISRLAAKKAKEGVDHRLAREIKRSVGVEVAPFLHNEPKIAAAMETAAKANAALIVDIPSKAIGQIKNVIAEGWSKGARWEALVKDVDGILDDTETRARLIARDQMNKMNAAFNEIRQTSLGIPGYSWSGVLDRRERPSHVRMEGTKHEWSKPPLVDGEHVHPGQAIQCRCLAQPVFAILEQPAKVAA